MSTLTAHGLVCLDEEDYAALALAMQADALATDAALDAISDGFDSFLARPTVLAVTTAASGPNSSSSETIFSVTSWSLTYTNFTPVPTLAAAGGFRMTIPRSGWYAYGGYESQVATGAVTAFSRRTAYATATRRITGLNTVLSRITWRTVDTNTAGEHLVVTGGSFYAVAGTVVDVELQWSHANAASTVQVPAGSKLWCYFIGSGVEIGSA